MELKDVVLNPHSGVEEILINRGTVRKPMKSGKIFLVGDKEAGLHPKTESTLAKSGT